MKAMGDIKEKQDAVKIGCPVVFRSDLRGIRVRRLLFNSEAVAAVELALILPLLFFILVMVLEFGHLAYFSIAVSNAAYAGAAHGSANHTEIEKAARCDARDVSEPNVSAPAGGFISINCGDDDPINSGLTVTQTPSCTCPGSEAIVDCASITACDGGRKIHYIQVNTSATINPLFDFPGISSLYDVSGQATMTVAQ